MASLDPRLPVYDLIAEPMRHNGYSKEHIDKRITELMTLVGLEPSHANRYARTSLAVSVSVWLWPAPWQLMPPCWCYWSPLARLIRTLKTILPPIWLLSAPDAPRLLLPLRH